MEASVSALEKKVQGQHASEDHDGIRRRAFRRQIGQFAEDDGKDHHRQKWPDQRPRGPNHGLLVADRDIAPSQHPKELAILPKISPIMAFGATGFNNNFVRHLHVRKEGGDDCSDQHTLNTTLFPPKRKKCRGAATHNGAAVVLSGGHGGAVPPRGSLLIGSSLKGAIVSRLYGFDPVEPPISVSLPEIVLWVGRAFISTE